MADHLRKWLVPNIDSGILQNHWPADNTRTCVASR